MSRPRADRLREFLLGRREPFHANPTKEHSSIYSLNARGSFRSYQRTPHPSPNKMGSPNEPRLFGGNLEQPFGQR